MTTMESHPDTESEAKGRTAEKERGIDRRGLLARIAAVAAGALAASFVPGVARATDGYPVYTAQESDASSEKPGLWGRNQTGSAGLGVRGDSENGDGVLGTSHGMNRSGVVGWSTAPSGYGVHGDGETAGVHGVSTAGDGVKGEATAYLKRGVYGSSPSGYGVWGDGGTTGCGVYAKSASGNALIVDGKAWLGKKVAVPNRSGVGTIPAGAAFVVVTPSYGLDANSMYLATLQSDAGPGVYVQYAGRYGTNTFRVVLNKPAAKAAKFAWMVVDH